MILLLSKGTIKIQPMRIPERRQSTEIKYVFESGTNHLIPKLYIHKDIFQGDKIMIDMSKYPVQDQLNIKVELVNHYQTPVKIYEGTVQQHDYILLGKKPVRPDVEKYIKELEARIVELEEQGEVI
jgi:FMN phosphatase YigB (HAD superfamily)